MWPFVVVGLLCAVVQAGSPLRSVPADVAGILATRNLDELNSKLHRLVDRLGMNWWSKECPLFEVHLGFEADAWDTSKPVLMVLPQSDLSKMWQADDGTEGIGFVLGLTPRDLGVFTKKYRVRARYARAVETGEGAFYLTLHDNMVFVSSSRKAIRMVARVEESKSLDASLDARQRALYRESDLFVHIPLHHWHDKIGPYVSLVANILKLEMSAKQERQTGSSSEVVDWVIEEVRRAIGDMRTLTVALSLDGGMIQLDHDHTFCHGSAVAEHLSHVQRIGVDPWVALPDRPFVVAAGVDWRVPADTSFSVRVYKRLLGLAEVKADLPKAKRERMLKASASFAAQSYGSYFMLSVPEDRVFPSQVLGGYILKDAGKGLRQMRYLQENACEAMGAFMPGGRSKAQFEKRKRSGFEYLQVAWDLDATNRDSDAELVAVYGSKVRLQQAVVAEHHLAYCLAEPPVGVWDMKKAVDQGPSITHNEQVRRMLKRLPQDANAKVVVDVGRSIRWLFVLVNRVSGQRRGVSPPPDSVGVKYESPPGPMIGWSGTARADAFGGRLLIEVDELPRILKLLKRSDDKLR